MGEMEGVVWVATMEAEVTAAVEKAEVAKAEVAVAVETAAAGRAAGALASGIESCRQGSIQARCTGCT